MRPEPTIFARQLRPTLKPVSRQRGFTLIEILVAFTITAIIMVAAGSGLSRISKNRVSLETRFDAMQKLQMAIRVLSRDIEQVQPRGVRDLVGQDQLAAVLTADSDAGMEMTVGGYSNPLKLPRSQLQRVGYELEDDILYRIHWPVLDRTQGTLPVRRKLLEGVLSMNARFMDVSGDWSQSWPAAGATDARSLPRAIEVTLDIENVGIIRRVIEVATG